MPRMMASEYHETESDIHKRNVACSNKLLAMLRVIHGTEAESSLSEPETAPEPEPVVKPIIPTQPPIPNYVMADAADLASMLSEPFPPTTDIKIRTIQVAVCKEYGVSLTDMLSSRRTQKVCRPRQVGYYLAKTLTGRSLPEIGRRFGGRDHTTALSGIRKIEALRQTDAALNARLHSIAETLGTSLA